MSDFIHKLLANGTPGPPADVTHADSHGTRAHRTDGGLQAGGDRRDQRGGGTGGVGRAARSTPAEGTQPTSGAGATPSIDNSGTLRKPKSLTDLPAAGKSLVLEPESLRRPKLRKGRDDWEVSSQGRNIKIRALRDAQDELQFAEWYSQFEDELEDADNDEYAVLQATLDSQLMTCQYLLTTTDATLNLASSLHNAFQAVESQTSAFEKSCNSILQEQKRLENLAEGLATNLQPFTELEPITRILNRPGYDFVKTASFREILARLDGCLEYMDEHRNFREVETYAPKFRQCMTRALQLILHYFVASVREVADEVAQRIKEQQMNDTTQSAFLYAKFRVNAPLLRELVGEIDQRCESHEEYVSILNECYLCFTGIRQRLVLPIATKRMSELSLTSTASDLVAFARSAIGFQCSLCLDEFDLFHAYFSGKRSDAEVYKFLKTLCKPLYDTLRPKVSYETDIVKLCELCTLLQTRYMQSPEEEPDFFDRSQLDLGQLVERILQEAQDRIVYLAKGVVDKEIRNFTPKPQDLEPPGEAESSSQSPAPEDDAALFDTSTVFHGWYPTLRKCIWLLSNIYRLVNPTVFDELAHNTVRATTGSLVLASQRIAAQKSPSDGHLFLTKHLIVLKEQLVAFDIEFAVDPDVHSDSSDPSGTLRQLLERGNLMTSADLRSQAPFRRIASGQRSNYGSSIAG